LLHEAYQSIGVPVGVLQGWINLRQNNHVLRASRGKRAPQKTDHKAIYVISQILGLKENTKAELKPIYAVSTVQP
jgi:hypothetical protein